MNGTRSVPGQAAGPDRDALYGRLFEAIGPAYANLAEFGAASR